MTISWKPPYNFRISQEDLANKYHNKSHLVTAETLYSKSEIIRSDTEKSDGCEY